MKNTVLLGFIEAKLQSTASWNVNYVSTKKIHFIVSKSTNFLMAF